jgi:hypothetical protein
MKKKIVAVTLKLSTKVYACEEAIRAEQRSKYFNSSPTIRA